MKLAISGKGGVGKTTLASLLARIYASEGATVLAVDADPDANLAIALGFPADLAAKIQPISEMADLIEERTGARPGTSGGYFRLNPEVSDIPERFCGVHQGVKLLLMGTVSRGGGGCVCPENILLKSLMDHLVIQRDEVVIMDMVAGVEHLGRGTASFVDALICVVEPGRRSIQTAQTVQRLASDIGVKRIFAVGSKVNSDRDREYIRTGLPGIEVLGFLSQDDRIAEADLRGLSPFDLAPNAVAEAREIRAELDRRLGSGAPTS